MTIAILKGLLLVFGIPLILLLALITKEGWK